MPRHFLGRLFSLSMTAQRSRLVTVVKSVPFGRYCRISPLPFSFDPPLPGSVGMCKVELRAQCPGDGAMTGKLTPVVRGQRVNTPGQRPQKTHRGLADRISAFVQDLVNHHQAGFSLAQGHQRPLVALADDGVESDPAKPLFRQPQADLPQAPVIAQQGFAPASSANRTRRGCAAIPG